MKAIFVQNTDYYLLACVGSIKYYCFEPTVTRPFISSFDKFAKDVRTGRYAMAFQNAKGYKCGAINSKRIKYLILFWSLSSSPCQAKSGPTISSSFLRLFSILKEFDDNEVDCIFAFWIFVQFKRRIIINKIGYFRIVREFTLKVKTITKLDLRKKCFTCLASLGSHSIDQLPLKM